MRCKLLALGIATVLCPAFWSGCGGSGGSKSQDLSESGARVAIVAPQDGAELNAGEVINYQLKVDNFVLSQPAAAPAAHKTLKHNGVEHNDDNEAEEHASGEDEHNQEGEVTDPEARSGHFHIYLDDEEEHKTGWEESGEFVLPESVESGSHTLRFELRNDQHVLVGAEGSEAVLFFEVK